MFVLHYFETKGLEIARDEALRFLDEFKTNVSDVSNKDGVGAKEEKKDDKNSDIDRDVLVNAARTSLRTKLNEELADHLTDIVVDAVLTVRDPQHAEKHTEEIDLKMVEIMVMTHKSEFDTKLVKGLVLDHGARHPNMAKRSEDCFILTANFSLEWEKTEVNSAFFWSTAEQREKLVAAERKHTYVLNFYIGIFCIVLMLSFICFICCLFYLEDRNEKAMKIIELKKKVCSGDNKDKSFVLVNQQGIDPISLDLLQKEGIVGIRRAKRRNMERIPLACGGYSVNSENDLSAECLGYAGLVYEHTLGDDKFTFIEDVKNAFSCTILIRGMFFFFLVNVILLFCNLICVI